MCFICFICFFVYAVSFIAMLQSPSLMVLLDLIAIGHLLDLMPLVWNFGNEVEQRDQDVIRCVLSIWNVTVLWLADSESEIGFQDWWILSESSPRQHFKLNGEKTQIYVKTLVADWMRNKKCANKVLYHNIKGRFIGVSA